MDRIKLLSQQLNDARLYPSTAIGADNIKPTIIVRVFAGSLGNIQESLLIPELRSPLLPVNHVVEVLTMNVIRKSTPLFTPSDLVEWLLSSHIHFIPCHPHQGASGLNWDVVDLYNQLKRLEDHPGFPNKGYLTCPIFTQNKIEYLHAVPQFTNPTLQIKLDPRRDAYSETSETYQCIKEFMKEHENVTSGKGFILKAPFVTNKLHFQKICKTLDEVIAKLIVVATENFSLEVKYIVIPYIMLQPTMSNTKEYKIVCVNGEPHYEITQPRGGIVTKAYENPETRRRFAKQAIQALHEAFPNRAILDGLIRVDIFCNNQGNLVVNEFEGFEAMYGPAPYGRDLPVTFKISQFWRLKVEETMKNFYLCFPHLRDT